MGETASEKDSRLGREAQNRFEAPYTYAMLGWANIENALCFWFQYLSGLSEIKARAIFYSARSFQGRIDMINALLEISKIDAELAAYLKKVITKSRTYSSARNKIAHRISTLNTSDPDSYALELIEGGLHPGIGGPPINEADLLTIAQNFSALNQAITSAWLHQTKKVPPERIKPLQEHLERLALLPNEADSKELSRKQQGRLRQKKSSPQ